MRVRGGAAIAATLLLAACGGSETSSGGGSEAPTPASAANESAPAPAASAPPPPPTAEERLAAAPDLDKGQRLFRQCQVCHSVEEGGPSRVGPNLYGLIGSPAAAKEDFSYSNALKEAGFVWTTELVDQWLEKPREFLPGNRMAFPGVPNAADRRDLIAYMVSVTGGSTGEEPASEE